MSCCGSGFTLMGDGIRKEFIADPDAGSLA